MNVNVFPVMPVRANGIQGSEPNAAEISASIRESLPGRHGRNLESRDEQETRGPLKEIVANQDSLYKYINWEDPVKTLGSYLGVMSILFGTHYLPLTRYALKAGAIALGVMSVTEFAGRSFGPDTFLSRLRPQQYKRVPESTLNATLKDVHDFVQYAVVKIQKVFWGQDLDRTFAAFVAFTGLYWLVKIMNPFGLVVLGVNLIYMAPLVTSPRGREIAQNAVEGAGDLANTAAEKSVALAQQGKAQAVDLTSQVTDKSAALAQQGKAQAVDLTSQVTDKSAALAQQGKAQAADLTSKASETANQVRQRGEALVQTGKETVSDVSKQDRDTSSNVSRRTQNLNQSGEQTGFQLPSQSNDLSSGNLPSSNPFSNNSASNTTSSQDRSFNDLSTNIPSYKDATSNGRSFNDTSFNGLSSNIHSNEPVHNIGNISDSTGSYVNTVGRDSGAGATNQYDNNDNHYVFGEGNSKFDNRGHAHLPGSEPRQANFSPGISRKEVSATQDVKPIQFPEAVKPQSFMDSA